MSLELPFFYIKTPLGWLQGSESAQGIRTLCFVENPQELGTPPRSCLYQAQLEPEIHAYFAGSLSSFTVPCDPLGSAFEKDVWRATLQIPYGSTASYKEIAIRSGHPLAYRAVGTALSKNPLLLLIPCHRVIRSNGNLGQFSAYVSCKEELIERERRALHSNTTSG